MLAVFNGIPCFSCNSLMYSSTSSWSVLLSLQEWQDVSWKNTSAITFKVPHLWNLTYSVTQLERLVKVFLVPDSCECSGLLAVLTICLLVVILSTCAAEWKHQLAFRGFEKQHRVVETSRRVHDSPDNKIFSRNIRIFVYNDEVTQRISKCAVAIGIQRWHLHTAHAPPLLPCTSTWECWSDHQIELVDVRGSGKLCLLRNSFTSGCDIISWQRRAHRWQTLTSGFSPLRHSAAPHKEHRSADKQLWAQSMRDSHGKKTKTPWYPHTCSTPSITTIPSTKYLPIHFSILFTAC